MHQRAYKLPFVWPDPPLNVVLVEPEIPPNTGNIARLCAATGSTLHLVEPLGFRLTSTAMKRAGLDYWDKVKVVRHPHLESCMAQLNPGRAWFFSTGGNKSYIETAFRPGDALIFGSENRGLHDDILAHYAGQVLGIPQVNTAVRSINLSNAVAIAVYEALRQINILLS